MLRKITNKMLKLEREEISTIVRDGIYIILFSILAGFIINLFSPKGFVLTSKTAEKSKEIVLISSEEARVKKDCSAVFLDARQQEEFQISHITSSINIPAIPSSEAASRIKENPGILDRTKEIVIYCDGLSCGSSQSLSNTLLKMGYSRHIYVIKNGITEWEAKGFPVEKDNPEETE